ncbi:flagellar basal body P-ring biosynthesis protein FlgA [Thalassovita gelatinovora]|uniref:Flagella basal body P-ring formation protein FlgA n=1 Tax=Thalassovita gelatinovora TaxID=53501 RepID=A0A0N7LVK4_THAGE|nr:flagellar basal body P-ring formation chaperone FlgA [Thalassovita gelatinovora]QIZ79618.1 flagellar basal body P-ring formation protein FlgA [Thalassovita gelatinovora]CUH66546.1 flagellar basal body P-ring biosynthesis protein FlgA [Thalassovita gelatinovora]SEQ37727.1 flagella basal body P-ring formation protein FlgA [Thalassovita gelatinovora]
MNIARALTLALTLAATTATATPDGGTGPAYPDGIGGADLTHLLGTALQKRGLSAGGNMSAARSFPPCDHTPEISPSNGSWALIRLSCSAPRPWIRHLRTDARPGPTLRGPRPAAPAKTGTMIATLSRSLKRGSVITQDDIAMVPAGSGAALGTFTDPADLIGRRLVTNVAGGRKIQARQLEQNWLITRDTPVAIRFSNSAISINMPGIALENGQLGELIKIRNSSSGRVLRAIVAGPQKVQIIAKTN